MEGSKTLLCPSEFPQACGSISLKFTDNMGTRLFANPAVLVRLALH
jgi:hypothetical protein